MMVWSRLLILCGFCGMMHAQEVTLYKGTLGAKYPIHLELECWGDEHEDKNCHARYAYDKYLIDTPLRGKENQVSIKLNSGYFYEEKPTDSTEVFVLQRNTNGLEGTWKLGTKALKVQLKAIGREDYSYGLENSYNQIKLKKLEFVRDSIQKYDQNELVWFTEKFSGEVLFRLGNGFSVEQREFLNPKLDSLHWERALGKLECNSWYDIGTEVFLANGNYLSFIQHSSVYCGGAHPSYGKESYNFDLQENKEIKELEDLFPGLDWYSFLEQKYFESDNECDYFGENQGNGVWSTPVWTFDKEGIYIRPSYPHAGTACEESFFLSYLEIGIPGI